MAAIEVRGLEREFGDGVKAVRGVDLDVAEGEIYAFLGPNGAGKTTTVRMLTTLLRPTGGTAKVAGHDVVTEAGEVRKSIGVALQEAALDPLMTGRELIRLQATLHGLARAEGEKRAEALLDRVDLDLRRRPPGRHVLGRHEAPARPRVRARPPASRPLPRRADDRPRPGQPQGDLGGGPGAERRRRDDLPDHAVPGGGRPARRPRGDHRRRAPGRRGHADRAQGRDRACPPRDRGLRRRAGARRRRSLPTLGKPLPSRGRPAPARARRAEPRRCARRARARRSRAGRRGPRPGRADARRRLRRRRRATTSRATTRKPRPRPSRRRPRARAWERSPRTRGSWRRSASARSARPSGAPS